MNEENGKHEFNFFLDKQLQQKLLEANEELQEKEFTSYLLLNNLATNKNNANVVAGAQQNHKLPKYLDCVHVCGWCPNPSTVYRKPEGDTPSRSRGSLAITRDSLFSRDSKSRLQNNDNFVFRHYSDPRRYIEQYRKEHACYDSTNSSAAKNEFLETRRFYAYNQYSPLAVGSNSNSAHQQNSYAPQPQLDPPVQSNDTTSKPHPQTPSLQYTNRREQKRNTISANLISKNQHQYKLTKTPPNNKPDRISDYTEEYIESLEVIKKQRHSGSAKERSSATVNTQKSAATKINVPSANFGGKTLRTANTGVTSDNTLPSHFPGHKSGQNTTGRMLDTLSCVAGNGSGADKQPQLPSLPNQSTPSKSGTPSKKTRPTDTTTPTSTIATISSMTNTTTTTTTDNTTTSISTPYITTSSTTSTVVTTPKIAFATNNNITSSNGMNNDSHLNRFSNNHDANNDCSINRNIIKSANKLSNEVNDSSSTTSEVSISQLSTTCLGADANVKSRPKLEASRTYHVFPNEFSSSSTSTNNTLNYHQHQQQSHMLSVVWNPGKSAVIEKRPRPTNVINNLAADMMGIVGPFRNSPRRPATEEGGHRAVEFVTKEFIQDAKPLNLRTTDVFRDVARMGSSACVSPGLKTNTIKPDLPPSFSLQGVTKKPQFETLKKKRRASKTAVVRRKKEPHPEQDGGRKSWSASTDASNQSTSGGGSTLRLKPVPCDATGNSPAGNGSTNTGHSSVPAPYFKFWNSSLPPKSRDGRRRGGGGGGGGGDKMSADIDMQQLAEMVLADENGNDDTDLAHAAKRVLEHKIKSDSEQGIATGDSGVTPTLDRASKEGLLDSLRSVNQRPPKPSPRPLHLTYLTGEMTAAESNNNNKSSSCSNPNFSRKHCDCGNSCSNQPHPQKKQHEDLNVPVTSNSRPCDCSACNGCSMNEHVRRSSPYSNDFSSDGEKNVWLFSENNKSSDLDVDDAISVRENKKNGEKRFHNNNARKEIIFMSEEEGTELLSSAKQFNSDSDFLSTLSDWKQICAEYKDSSSLLREAKSKEYKALIANRFDKKSSLSHQRRIKHLIEQSRLKSHMGRLSGTVGYEPVHKFIDIKTGIHYESSTTGDLGKHERVNTKNRKLQERNCDNLVKGKKSNLKAMSRMLNYATDEEYNDTNKTHNERCNSVIYSNHESTMDGKEPLGKDASCEIPPNRIHVVPCGVDSESSESWKRKFHGTNDIGQHNFSCNIDNNSRQYLTTTTTTSNLPSTAVHVAGKTNRHITKMYSSTSRRCEKATCETEISKCGINSDEDNDNKSNLNTSVMKKSAAENAHSHHNKVVMEYSNSNSNQPFIPLICGTAIREKQTVRGSLKSKSYNVPTTVSSKPIKLSPLAPLSESDIDVLASKLAVKVNMTRLKYTQSGDVERARSMHL